MAIGLQLRLSSGCRWFLHWFSSVQYPEVNKHFVVIVQVAEGSESRPSTWKLLTLPVQYAGAVQATASGSLSGLTGDSSAVI